MSAMTYVLGSRSPRRLELLTLLAPQERIVVKPPVSPDEADFDGLTDRTAIRVRLSEIVFAKLRDVEQQLTTAEVKSSICLVADTIIIATDPAGRPIVLGKPPDHAWQATMRDWLTTYYSNRTHEAWTAVCVWGEQGVLLNEIVQSAVTFREITPPEIEWYVSTGESQGKAGGYALQGLASVFVSRVEGSLSNVVGLPLEAVRKVIPRPVNKAADAIRGFSSIDEDRG